MDNLSKAKNVAIEIARCSAVREAFADVSHPCNRVVLTQKDDGFRQLPEPWYGNITSCKVLFISSNPSIDESDRDMAEVFPTESWEDSQIGSWVMNRVIDGSADSGVTFNLDGHQNFLWKCVDGKFRGQGKKQENSQTTWNGIHKRAIELLGIEANPSKNYALTEVVHCKSKMAEGVKESAKHCSDRWMNRIIDLSDALNVVVLVGSHVRDQYAREKFKLDREFGKNNSEKSYFETIKSNSFISNVFGKPLLFVYLAHPTSMTTKTFQSKYGEEVTNKISSIAAGKIAVPEDSESWFNYLSS